MLTASLRVRKLGSSQIELYGEMMVAARKEGSAQEFVETRISGCFLKNDEFCFCDRHALCLKQ
jgi:hypothetical protein